MLGLYEFNGLSEEEKYAYVWDKCTFLANYMGDEIFAASLYYAPGPFRISFFIERGRSAVWCNVAENKLDGLNSFRTTKRLNHYLDEIDIQSLFR